MALGRGNPLTMKQLPDGALLRAWRSGESAAFAELVERHQDALLRHARGVLGSGSQHEDVVQEAFLNLARNAPELPREVEGDPDAERRLLLAWLHKVVRNGCMDVIRSETRRRRREEAAASPEHEGGGLETVDARDTRALVEAKLGELPVEQREVLVLRLLSERSYREIAEITGKKVGTVGWLVSEGLKALATKLEPLLAGEITNTRNAGSAVRGEA